MTHDEAAREITDLRRTIDRQDAVLADMQAQLREQSQRLRMLERDAMSRGSQVVSLRTKRESLLEL